MTNEERKARTVTISPNPVLWDRYTKNIISKYGNRTISKNLEVLINQFIDADHTSFDIDFVNDYDTNRISLSIDRPLWDKFSDSVNILYGKKKIRSSVINKLISDHLKLSKKSITIYPDEKLWELFTKNNKSVTYDFEDLLYDFEDDLKLYNIDFEQDKGKKRTITIDSHIWNKFVDKVTEYDTKDQQLKKVIKRTAIINTLISIG